MAYREGFDLGKTTSKTTEEGLVWNPKTQHFEPGGGETPGDYGDRPTRWTVPQRQTGSTTVTSWAPSGEKPSPYTVVPFEAPEWDEEEISRLTRKRAAPGVRRLRSAVQMAMTRPYESPQIRRMTLREALAGFGMGLESVMGAAGREAVGEYGAEYGREWQAGAMNWQALQQQRMADWQALWNVYMRSGKQVSKTQIQYGGGEEEEYDPWARPWVKVKPAGYIAKGE